MTNRPTNDHVQCDGVKIVMLSWLHVLVCKVVSGDP